jgi:hypothetical protein
MKNLLNVIAVLLVCLSSGLKAQSFFIETIPDSAYVFVDDKFVGVSPCRADIKFSEKKGILMHSIRFKKDKYDEKVVTLKKDEGDIFSSRQMKETLERSVPPVAQKNKELIECSKVLFDVKPGDKIGLHGGMSPEPILFDAKIPPLLEADFHDYFSRMITKSGLRIKSNANNDLFSAQKDSVKEAEIFVGIKVKQIELRSYGGVLYGWYYTGYGVYNNNINNSSNLQTSCNLVIECQVYDKRQQKVIYSKTVKSMMPEKDLDHMQAISGAYRDAIQKLLETTDLLTFLSKQ